MKIEKFTDVCMTGGMMHDDGHIHDWLLSDASIIDPVVPIQNVVRLFQ